jgi:uncharacterized protein YkwD
LVNNESGYFAYLTAFQLLIFFPQNIHSHFGKTRHFSQPQIAKQQGTLTLKMSKEDKAAALKLHNEARHDARGARRHDLIWDNALAVDAERYAIQMAMKGKFEHSSQQGPPTGRGDQGENLYWCSGSTTYAEATQRWVDEKPLYNGEVLGGEAKGYGHYTQVCLIC